MDKKGIVLGILVIILIGGGWALFSARNHARSSEPITVGFIGPLTGDVSSLGTVARSAVELAAKEINDKGGINGRPLKVVYEDGQCNAQAAGSAASKLISTDKVTAIIGGFCSSETSAFAKQAMDNKVITLSYCSSAPSLSQTGPYFVRDYPSDAYQGKFAAEYAYNTLGVRKAAILYHISDAETAIKDVFSQHFQQLGGTIVDVEGSPQESRDYRTALTKIKATGVSFIYMPMYSEGSIVAVQQAKELGITAQLLGSDPWADTKFQHAVADYGTLLYTEVRQPDTTAFTHKLQEFTGGQAGQVCSAQAYDATYILANALTKVGTDPYALSAALHATNYDGTSGHIEFDANGDMKQAAYVVKKIENGTATVVE